MHTCILIYIPKNPTTSKMVFKKNYDIKIYLTANFLKNVKTYLNFNLDIKQVNTKAEFSDENVY